MPPGGPAWSRARPAVKCQEAMLKECAMRTRDLLTAQNDRRNTQMFRTGVLCFVLTAGASCALTSSAYCGWSLLWPMPPYHRRKRAASGQQITQLPHAAGWGHAPLHPHTH
jgi:hypothetical protein